MDTENAPPPDRSLQERFAPNLLCFGCGPANEQGLRIRSVPNPDDPDEVVLRWQAHEHHQAFPGMINGGIIGSLLDCHCNWTAAWKLMRIRGEAKPPCTVTADYAVKLLRPTPLDAPVEIRARAVEVDGDKVIVEATLTSTKTGKVCATCRGTFVAVKEGHPAYHRW
jgi:acyl-coenzyme A thioesterase PaaI-like protein